jgi:hypothetical protein
MPQASPIPPLNIPDAVRNAAILQPDYTPPPPPDPDPNFVEIEIDGAVVQFPASMGAEAIHREVAKLQGPSLLQRVIPTGLRVAPAIAGGILGSVGGPPGVALGGAIGAGLGEYAGELYERDTDQRQAINPTQIAVQAGLGAIPLGKVPGAGATAEQLVRYAATVPQRRALQGAALGAAGAVATNLAETGELPSPSRLVVPTAFGAVTGGVGGRFERAPLLTRAELQAAADAAALAARQPRGALPPGPQWQVLPDGRVVPFGSMADAPALDVPDPSFVRGVSGEYPQRDVRGALPPGPRFEAGESGPARPFGTPPPARPAITPEMRRRATAIYRSEGAARNASAGMPTGTVIEPMPTGRGWRIVLPDADPSYVRSVPGEYPRREPAGELPPPRGFVAPESGPAVPVEQAPPVVPGRLPVIDAEPVTVGESSVRSVPAAVLDREFVQTRGAGGKNSQQLVPRQFSSDPNAVDAPLVDLTPQLRHALNWIREDYAAHPFTKRSFIEAGPGRGGDLDVIPGAAGTAIHSYIVGSRNIGRADVLRAIENLEAGKLTPLGADVMNVARELSEGRRSATQHMTLPPDAGGDLAGTIFATRGEGGIPTSGSNPQGHGPHGYDTFSAGVDDAARSGPDTPAGGREPGEEGFIRPEVAARVALGGAGVAYGAATGDTPEERAERAALFGALGAAAPSAFTRGKSARPITTAAAGMAGEVSTVPSVRPSRARASVPAGPIPHEQVLSFNTIRKMPRQVQGEVADLLGRFGGFQGQRRGVQSFERTQALADRIDVPLETLVKGQALNAEELTAYRNAVGSVFAQRQPLAEKVAAGTASDAEKVLFSQLTHTATTLLASLRGATAEAGRALGALRMEAQVLNYGDAAFIRKALGAPGFEKNLERIARAAVEAGGDPLKQLQSLRAATAASTFDRAQALWYNGLLSGPRTHIRNSVANSFALVTNLAGPLTAAPIDAVRSMTRGTPRTVSLGEIPEAVVATFTALPQGFRDALFTLRHGFSPRVVRDAAAGVFDTVHPELPGGIVTNLPSRALEAADVFFRSLAYQQELVAAAYTRARQQSSRVQPDALAARMAELMAGDGPESQALRRQADAFAARAVFQEQPGPVLQKIIALKNDPEIPAAFRAAMTFVLPFIKTPGNVLRQGAEFSPLGFTMKAAHQGGREGAQALGRATMGSILLAPLAYLAAGGRLSGSGPTDRSERAALMESGWRPNSLKVGDRWVEFNLAQPIGVAMAAVGNAWERFSASNRSDAAAEESFTAALSGAASSFLSQSFLAGLSGALDAVQDPDRAAGRLLTQAAQGAVPYSGLARNITQAIDPVVREPEGIRESVQAIIPGQSHNVPPRLDRFGEPVKRPGGAARRGVLVPNISEETHKPINEFLAALDITPDLPQARLTERGQRLEITRDQEFAIRQAIGQERQERLERLMADVDRRPGARRSDQLRRTVQNILSDATETVNRKAKARLRRGLPLTVEALTGATAPIEATP